MRRLPLGREEGGRVPGKDGCGGAWSVFRGDALDAYALWPAPSAIISDGAYGVGGFPGDPRTADGLVDWYEPTSSRGPSTPARLPLCGSGTPSWGGRRSIPCSSATAGTTSRPSCGTRRRPHSRECQRRHHPALPGVTEVCVFYRRRLEFPTPDGVMSAKQWLRYEWRRAGLPLHRANQACGVANAATRKYLTQDWLWYLPPTEMMERLVDYANEHGRAAGAPYFLPRRRRARHRHGVGQAARHLEPTATGSPTSGRPRRCTGTSATRATACAPRPGSHRPAGTRRSTSTRSLWSSCAGSSPPAPSPATPCGSPSAACAGAVVAAIELGRDGYAAEPVEHFADLAIERIESAVDHQTAEARNRDRPA